LETGAANCLGRIAMIKHNDPPRLGVGLYSIPNAARLLKSSVGSLRRWIDPVSGVVHCVFYPEERTVTFRELMELHFVKLFREGGVSLPTIRKAAKIAAMQFGADHPFAVHRFETDGRTLFSTFVRGEKKAALIEDIKQGQHVFDTVVRPFFKKLEYSQDEAIRFWPLGIGKRVVLDPARQFGKPIDNDTAVPTAALYNAVVAGEEPGRVAKWFDVPLDAVRAAIAFEKSLAA
jgi:uncharacterized protein (DUF433 family)